MRKLFTLLSFILLASFLWPTPSDALVHPVRRTWANYRAHAACRRAMVGQKFVIDDEVRKAKLGYYSVVATKKDDLAVKVVTVSDFDGQLICRVEVTNSLVTAIP